MNSPHVPEKNKKVSRACNTCRLKRKKCDGLEPCIFCTETKVECSYSREPRRRGPPSGYLRYTETRVALFETLLGLFIQTSGQQSIQTLSDAVRTLMAQSKTHTQDVWDAYKRVWTDSDASRGVHELASVFAPFSPAENQTPAPKSLLPPAGRPQQPVPSPSLSPPPPVFPYTNESFERTTTHEPPITSNDLLPMRELRRTAENEQLPARSHAPDIVAQMDVHADLPMPIFLPSPPADFAPSSSEYQGAYWRTAALASPSPTFASLPLPLSPTIASFGYLTASRAPTPTPADLPPPHVRAALLATYRTAVHLSLPILSPAQIATLDAGPSATCSSTSNAQTTSPMLLLALCAYTARLAPPAASPTRVAADLWYESASALLASALRRPVVHIDVVQTLLLLGLRDHGRGRDAMAWRGVGAAVRLAVELGLDAADDAASVRTASHAHGGEETGDDEGRARDRAWQRGLWGVASMIDLFLSIQLGRAPASAEALRPLGLPSLSAPSSLPPTSIAHASSNNSLPSPSPSAASTSTAPIQPGASPENAGMDGGESEEDAEAALFAHVRSLVRIVARVHFWVGLGYATSPGASTSNSTSSERGLVEDLTYTFLLSELVAWHRALPQRFRVALGGERVPRAVLEAHMLYQVGMGMLGRGRTASVPGLNGSASAFSGGAGRGFGGGYHQDAGADDAASTFNVLLDKYRPSLALAGPHVVWLVFAAARAALQTPGAGPGADGRAAGKGAGHGSYGTARALQTQLHLLNCREALTGMGGTWELARRCAHTLEHLMDGDAAGSKRKREPGADGRAGDHKRRDMEEGRDHEREREQHATWGALAVEPFDFDATAVWTAEFDGLGMGSGFDFGGGTGGAGLWDATWDEGLWSRGTFGSASQFGGSGAGFGLGLFDMQPGG
ncbi:hypothetical protein DFH07DRAFT_947186 [Mycena maculata]|uniref:Zn(2)-C6 fungal-type domain-containing protein n=1 Tax=Mycena maculata TaxID=230809 RepID=A0AAD7HF90_9AGAR|nr:hypothetical protein DFH07DRAFT_947186 [Mycena maculata]